MVARPSVALVEVEKLEQEASLAGYQYLPAVKADLLRRLGRTAEACEAYRSALALTTNEAERMFLSGQPISLESARGAFAASADRPEGSRGTIGSAEPHIRPCSTVERRVIAAHGRSGRIVVPGRPS